MSTQYEQQLPFRFHVGLEASTEQMEPARVTALLELQPHRTSQKGEVPQEMQDAPEKLRKVYGWHHKWAASFEPLTPTEPLNACLKRLALHLDRHSEPLVELAKDGDIKLYIYAYPGRSVQQPVDWTIIEGIRSHHPVGVCVNVYARHQTNRPVDADRPKNHT